MSEQLLELQHNTIKAQNTCMNEATSAIADAKVVILAQRSTIAQYEDTLNRVVANLESAILNPELARELIVQSRDLALDALSMRLGALS